MPAKDRYHNTIKQALINEGWKILADPYIIQYEDNYLQADLAASRPVAAQRGEQKIVVEIKTFSAPSTLNAFHAALGQYIFYRDLLTETAPEFDLYLATHETAYHRLCQKAAIRFALNRNCVNLIIVNLDHETIALWNPTTPT